MIKSCRRLETLFLVGDFLHYEHSIDMTCPNLKWLKLSLHHKKNPKDPRVVIDAPKLEYICIDGHNGFNRSKTVAVGNDAIWSGEKIMGAHPIHSFR